MLHVVAFLERTPRGRVDGLDERVRFLRVARGLVAAVEPRRKPVPADAASLLAHDAAVRRLCELADAVLPARFAPPLAGEAALRDAVEPRVEEIRDALERVRGREQMSLRVMRPESRVRAARGPKGRRYLEARRAALRVPALDPVRRALGRLVREERIEPHDAPPLLATVHHLIERGSAARYTARVNGTRNAPPLAIRGPFPPYAFAEPASGDS